MSGRENLLRSWRRHRTEYLAFLIFIAPNAMLFLTFTYWPIAYSCYLSLHDWNLLTGTGRWQGLENYFALWQSTEFWRVALNTLVYAMGVVVIAQSAAFFLALGLNRNIWGRSVYRTIAFTPHITTTAAAALVWILLLHPDYGPLSRLYTTVGMQGWNWLESGIMSLCALMVVGIWKEIGFASIFFLAGMQSLPQEPFEAARLDGASAWTRLRHLVIPLMSPVIFLLLVTGFIASIKAFDTVAIMTEGGPVYPDSSLYVYHLYKLAFKDFRAGYASAFALVFFIATVTITLVQFRLASKWVHYDD
ncbi:MAG: sugar ABC transporter permease [Candidatus Hydrogenedentota bacterium]